MMSSVIEKIFYKLIDDYYNIFKNKFISGSIHVKKFIPLFYKYSNISKLTYADSYYEKKYQMVKMYEKKINDDIRLKYINDFINYFTYKKLQYKNIDDLRLHIKNWFLNISRYSIDVDHSNFYESIFYVRDLGSIKKNIDEMYSFLNYLEDFMCKDVIYYVLLPYLNKI